MDTAPSIANGQSEKQPTPLMDTAPSITPASELQNAPPVTPGLFKRVVAKMRGGRQAEPAGASRRERIW